MRRVITFGRSRGPVTGFCEESNLPLGDLGASDRLL